MYSGFVFGGGTVHCHLFIYLFRLQLFFYHSVRFFFFFSHFFSCFALVFSILLFFVLVVVSIGIHHSIVDACVQFLLDFSLVYNSSKCECVSFCVWLWNELWNRILYNIAISPFRCYSLVSTTGFHLSLPTSAFYTMCSLTRGSKKGEQKVAPTTIDNEI